MMNGIVVDHVEVPEWTNTIPFDQEGAKGNPFVFVARIMELLDSDEVLHGIQHWIDLIFGKKSRGPEAVEAVNIFPKLTYEENLYFEPDAEEVTDHLASTIAQTYNFGQTPMQIFKKEDLKPKPLDPIYFTNFYMPEA
jgi:beige protein homolog 1